MSEPHEERPRPQFGEYASPEEQRARIQQPAESAPAAAPAPAGPIAGSASGSRSRLFDRLATGMLLGIGFVNLVTTLPSLFALTELMNQAYDQLAARGAIPSAPEFQGQQLAEALGWPLAIAWTALWVGAFAWVWPRMRAGRISFWIPLAAGATASLLLVGTAMLLVANDPGFLELVPQLQNSSS